MRESSPRRRVDMGRGPFAEIIGFAAQITDERASATNHTTSFFSASLGTDFDVSDLLEALRSVRDMRKARGRVFKLAFVLAVSLVAVLAGDQIFVKLAIMSRICRIVTEQVGREVVPLHGRVQMSE
jgi:hypothetical protein